MIPASQTMSRPGVSKNVMAQAEYMMWLGELNATRGKDNRPDWGKRRIAAERICEIIGIKDVIRAVALDGELRPAPKWPEVDIVPVGGGESLITCEVRTYVQGRGKMAVKIGLVKWGKKFDKAQIGEAMERGRWELKRLIDGT